MVEELGDLVDRFSGEAGRVRCFNHIVNLAAKSVIRQFDPPDKATADDNLEDLNKLVDDLEDVEEEDDMDGWVDEREEMTEEELAELEMDVKPTRVALRKVLLSRGLTCTEY